MNDGVQEEGRIRVPRLYGLQTPPPELGCVLYLPLFPHLYMREERREEGS